MDSQVLAVLVQELLLNHLSEHIRICILARLNVDGAHTVALVEAPQVPLLDGEDPLDVAYGLQLVFIDGHELVGVHLLEQCEADVEAERHCKDNNDTALDEA